MSIGNCELISPMVMFNSKDLIFQTAQQKIIPKMTSTITTIIVSYFSKKVNGCIDDLIHNYDTIMLDSLYFLLQESLLVKDRKMADMKCM